ncbi:MAG TPA: ABC transporter permease [Vicinamibacterales bacterium]|nr:ABC transporter permease [Vicinamibacterales bacterium]
MSLRRFFARNRWDAERARELQSYIEIEIDDNLARGMSPGDARDAARRKLGNQTLVREDIYHMNTIGLLDSAWRDLKFGARLLRLNPGFAAVAILSLALGIGANTAIFQLLDAVRLRTLPVANPQELVEVKIVKTRAGRTGDFAGRFSNLTFAQWDALRARQQAFSTLFAWGTTTFEQSTTGESKPAAGMWVSGEFFSALGVTPVLGRLLTTADDTNGCGAPGAVLSHTFWQRQYGGDPNIVGRAISLNARPLEIVGVAPAGFFGVEVGRVFDVAVPICANPLLEPEREAIATRNRWWLGAMGRLKPGWTPTRASAHLASLSPAVFADTLPPTYTAETANDYKQFVLGALPAGTGVSYLRQQYESPLWLLLAIAGLVLLIACGNLANLMLARASTRAREIAVRLAIGASRARLVRQLLAESALIAAIGAGFGVLVASQLERVLLSFFQNTWLFLDLRPDWRVLGFTIGVAVATCLIFGAMPALRATGIDPGAAMKSASRGNSEGRERFGLRRALVVAQVALSLVLVVGAGLFVRTLRNLATLDAGFQRTGILIAGLDARPLRLPTMQGAAVERDLRARVGAVPGVDAVATTYIVPVSGQGWNDRIVVDGVPQADASNFNEVSPGLLNTLGIALLRGRDFSDHDTPNAAPVAIVSQAFVAKYLGGRDPIGRTFTVETGPGEHAPTYHIVGVARDTKYTDLREEFKPLVYVPAAQSTRPDPFYEGTTLMIRSRAPLLTLVPEVKRAIVSVNAALLVDFQTLPDQVDKRLMRERLMAVLSGFFGGLAALLATIGLYGVMSYTVARRRNEIGIRMALGAERGDVVRMVMREAAMLLLAGVLVGGVLAVAAAQTAKTLLFGLKPGDPTTLALAVAGLAGVAMLASYVPALRASRLEPTEALRDE